MTEIKKLLLRISEAGEIAGCGRSKAFELAANGEWETVETPYGRRVVRDSLCWPVTPTPSAARLSNAGRRSTGAGTRGVTARASGIAAARLRS